MVDALDAGPVALRDHFPVGPDTDVEEVYAWLRTRIPELLVELVDTASRGELKLEAQPADLGLALRCYPRRPEDSRIDWRASATEVHRLVRASTRPMQGAFAFLEGERRVTVWRSAPVAPGEPFLAVPGQVCRADGGDPVVACGEGMLRLVEVAVEGCPDSATAKKTILSSLRNRLA
jgi:methionyl-tRNA formyltransferase